VQEIAELVFSATLCELEQTGTRRLLRQGRPPQLAYRGRLV
jgi:hypothetical protein